MLVILALASPNEPLKEPYSPPCDSERGGVIICNACYDCGASDNVCPSDFSQEISTATEAKQTMIICGGTGPSEEKKTIDCNECLEPSTIERFCSSPRDAGWCRFCFNNNCPNPTLKQATVTGTVYYDYSKYSDPDCKDG